MGGWCRVVLRQLDRRPGHAGSLSVLAPRPGQGHEALCQGRSFADCGDILLTDGIYRDYVIEFDVKLDEPADSGVFLRMGEDGKNHQVTLDNDTSKKFGWIYLSWGKGTVHESPEGLKHFRQGEWNSVKIRIEGEPSRIQVWLNGAHITDFQHTAETTEDVPKEGRIGLQIHAGADWSEGSRVRFRNIRLTEL